MLVCWSSESSRISLLLSHVFPSLIVVCRPVLSYCLWLHQGELIILIRWPSSPSRPRPLTDIHCSRLCVSLSIAFLSPQNRCDHKQVTALVMRTISVYECVCLSPCCNQWCPTICLFSQRLIPSLIGDVDKGPVIAGPAVRTERTLLSTPLFSSAFHVSEFKKNQQSLRLKKHSVSFS